MPSYTRRYISVFNSNQTEVLLDTGSNNKTLNSLLNSSEQISPETAPENVIILTKDKNLLFYLRENGFLAANSLVSRVYSLISKSLVNDLKINQEKKLVEKNKLIESLQKDLDKLFEQESSVQFNDIDKRNNLVKELDGLLCKYIGENKKQKNHDFDLVHDSLVNALVYTRSFKFPKEDPSKLHPSYSEDDQYGLLKNLDLPEDKTYCLKLNNSHLVNLYSSKKILWHVNNYNKGNESLEKLISRFAPVEMGSFLESILNFIEDNKLKSFFLGTSIVATFIYVPMYLTFFPLVSNILLFGISISTTQLITGLSVGLLPSIINFLMGLIDISVTSIVSSCEFVFDYIWNLGSLDALDEQQGVIKKSDQEHDVNINQNSYQVGRNDKYQNIYEGKLLNLPGLNALVVTLEKFARRYSNWSMSQSHINPISWSIFALARIANTHVNLWMDNFLAFTENLETETQLSYHASKEKSEKNCNTFKETHLALKRNANSTYTCFKRINNKLDFYKTISLNSLDATLRSALIENPYSIKKQIYKANNHIENKQLFDVENFVFNLEYPEILFVPEDIIENLKEDKSYFYDYMILEYFVSIASNSLSLLLEAIKLITVTAPILGISFLTNEIVMQLLVVTPAIFLLNTCTLILEYFEENTIKNYLYDCESVINSFAGDVRVFFRRYIAHINNYLYNGEKESFIFKDNILVDSKSASITAVCLKDILFADDKYIQSEITLKLDRAIETFNEVTTNINYFHNQLMDKSKLNIDLQVLEYLKQAKEIINNFNMTCKDLYTKRNNGQEIENLSETKILIKADLEKLFMLADYLDFVYTNKDKPIEHIITSKARFSDISAFEFLGYLTKVLCNQHVISNILEGSSSITLSSRIHHFEDFVNQPDLAGIKDILKALQDIRYSEIKENKTIRLQEKLYKIYHSTLTSENTQRIIENIYSLFLCLEQERYGKSGMMNLKFLSDFTSEIKHKFPELPYTPSNECLGLGQQCPSRFKLR